MQKIMFNDKCGLTQAVLDGCKTQTRRGVVFNGKTYEKAWVDLNSTTGTNFKDCILKYSAYKIGEVIAVAQSYKSAGIEPGMLQTVHISKPKKILSLDKYSEFVGWCDVPIKELPGWTNKMFVMSGLLPHHIRITNIRVERLQDISDEDCMAEGITRSGMHYGFDGKFDFLCPRNAYATLIDKVSGKGTWDSNPWVFVYDFELVD